MSDDNSVTKDAQIETITRSFLGSLYSWNAPEIVETVGPYFPDAFSHMAASMADVRLSLSQQIELLDTNELFHLYSFFDNNENLKRNRRQDQYDKFGQLVEEIQRIDRNRPVWFSGGLGHPEFQADVEHWSKLPFYKSDELLLLSCGVSPSKTTLLEMIEEEIGYDEGAWSVLDVLVDRSEIFSRQFNRQGFAAQAVEPIQFLNFVDFVGLEVEKTFLDALRKIHQPRKPKVKRRVIADGEKSLSAREKETLLMLVATMAIKGYTYDPNKLKNSCTSEIRTDLELLGFSMDDKTILKWLREAASLVDKGYWDKD